MKTVKKEIQTECCLLSKVIVLYIYHVSVSGTELKYAY